MKDELAIIVHEDEAGEITIQLHGGLKKAKDSFNNLNGKLTDPEARVSLVSIDFKNNKSTVRTKDLPVQGPSKDEQPDGIVLGKGPIWLDKEEETPDGS